MSMRHKLIIKANSASTLCGIKIVAIYPMDGSAMTDNVKDFSNGRLIEYTINDDAITCEDCKHAK